MLFSHERHPVPDSDRHCLACMHGVARRAFSTNLDTRRARTRYTRHVAVLCWLHPQQLDFISCEPEKHALVTPDEGPQISLRTRLSAALPAVRL